MNLNLQTLSHSPLSWKEALPPAFRGMRLPGATLSSASGEFGNITIQEFKSDQFTIRFNVLDLLQKFIGHSSTNESGFHSQLLIRGGLENELGNGLKWSLRRNQFALLHAIQPGIISVYKKSLHIIFEAFFSMKMVQEVLSAFPSIRKTITNPPQLVQYPGWVNTDSLEIAHSILQCKFEKDLRRVYFNNRVRDLLFNYLLQSTAAPNVIDASPTDKELEAIYRAEKIITQDVTAHFSVRELANGVLLNEFRFKRLFKKIFGVGPYEYLLKIRMNKARQWLEEGYSIKEVAAMTGYRPSDFTVAFKTRFGVSPSSIKRR